MYAEEKGCSMTQELLRDQQGTEHPVNLGGKDGETSPSARALVSRRVTLPDGPASTLWAEPALGAVSWPRR